jgi:hypothetical protein
MQRPLDTTHRIPPDRLRTLLHQVRNHDRITARMPATTLTMLLPDASPYPVAPESTAPLGYQPSSRIVIALSCAVTLVIGFALIALV